MRLKCVMGKIIDERQFAFIEGRSMLNSVVILNEVVHEAKLRKRSTLIFKVDYEKAYDSVEWSFLLYMLKRMNFSNKWINWVYRCLESATVSVLVNGSPTGEFKMERGLRQGNPLAPFLYLSAAEGLNGFS
ncbi:secreted RxLR effector protein 78-like [Lotus japonicus]|uniref:secreted RxLR effector protein 78-like n=1 Tax=Lotus japonicus TaxID=34305 RepID=UPI0025901982|nr:secreted RxLR effector protein 78-like [Lotus japonicus]